MSKYTTGEVARICGVSVRTVQYYDTRGILVPSELSDGGRRLYSESDLDKMKIICFLRGLDLSIDSIKALFCEENSDKVISLMLDEQEKLLRTEIAEKQERADKIAQTRKALSLMSRVTTESIGDIAHIIKNKKQLKKTRIITLLLGLLAEVTEIGTLILWITTGIWIPFALGLVISVIVGVCLSVFYFRRISYICPECHGIFKPSIKEAFFARHTPNTRRLTCPHCKHKGLCVETYSEEDSK